MVWLIVALIVIAALVMLLFPVEISAHTIRSEGKVEGNFSVSWLMLLLRYAIKDRRTEIFAFNRRIASRLSKEKKPQPKDLKRPEVSRKRIPPIRHVLAIAGPMWRLLKDLVTAFRLKYLDIKITYGLNDPAYTGILTGLLYAVRGSIQIGHCIEHATELSTRLTPDFTRQVMDWDIRTKVSITPIRIVLPVARFVIDRKVLRAGWGIIRG